MVRHALEQHDEVVVPVADNSRAVQHMHVLGGIKLGARGCGPVGQRLTVDGAAGLAIPDRIKDDPTVRQFREV